MKGTLTKDALGNFFERYIECFTMEIRHFARIYGSELNLQTAEIVYKVDSIRKEQPKKQSNLLGSLDRIRSKVMKGWNYHRNDSDGSGGGDDD